jgi:cytidyltransferase-like protein
MEKFHVQSAFQSSTSEKQYSMFIGRWQPLHEGHQYIFQQRLNKGKNILICIRDIEPDEKNPYKAEEVELMITEHYKEEIKLGKVKVLIIPDIESVNFGRGVGYDIIEHVVPDDIKNISATKIRENLKQEGKL